MMQVCILYLTIRKRPVLTLPHLEKTPVLKESQSLKFETYQNEMHVLRQRHSLYQCVKYTPVSWTIPGNLSGRGVWL